MSCVQELQQIEGFATANLAENYAVWTVSESCLEKIPDRHCRQAILRLPSLESDKVRLGELNLCGVLDEKGPTCKLFSKAEETCASLGRNGRHCSHPRR